MLRKLLCLAIILLSFQVSFAVSRPLATRQYEPTLSRQAKVSVDKWKTSHAQRRRGRPLWSGSRFTDLDRARALRRGLRFIYRTALNSQNFAEYGSDYLWCFYTLSSAMQDESLRREARRMGVERARHWRRLHRTLPRDADAGIIADFAFGSDGADSLNVRDEKLKGQIRRAAPRHNAREYLLFDPLAEPPPSDVPEDCEYDGAYNLRGSKLCHKCKRPLKMRSRYGVWYDALITTYSGDRFGVKLGARYADVLKWLPALRPYRGSEGGANPDFYETVYAITHIVYTLNNYSQYKLSPNLLPQEYQFLKDNLHEAIAQNDDDMLGEIMDSLRAFGLTTDDAVIRAGMEYYLTHQNPDGSWGDMKAKDIYDRYHPTWNAVAGLSEYSWRHGEGLSFPEIRPLLERLRDESSSPLTVKTPGVRRYHQHANDNGAILSLSETENISDNQIYLHRGRARFARKSHRAASVAPSHYRAGKIPVFHLSNGV